MIHQKAISYFCDPYEQSTHDMIESSIRDNEYRSDKKWGFKLKKEDPVLFMPTI